jgi:hypothetical protein
MGYKLKLLTVVQYSNIPTLTVHFFMHVMIALRMAERPRQYVCYTYGKLYTALSGLGAMVDVFLNVEDYILYYIANMFYIPYF